MGWSLEHSVANFVLPEILFLSSFDPDPEYAEEISELNREYRESVDEIASKKSRDYNLFRKFVNIHKELYGERYHHLRELSDSQIEHILNRVLQIRKEFEEEQKKS